MKAREWAARLTAAGADRAELMSAFVEEASAIARARGNTDSAAESAVREQRNKWRSVCLACPFILPSMFEEMLELYAPDLKQSEERTRAEAASRKGKCQDERDEVLAGRELAMLVKRS